MRKIWEISRRRFLGLLSAVGLTRATAPLATVAASLTTEPAAGFRVLNATRECAGAEQQAAQTLCLGRQCRRDLSQGEPL